MKRSPFPATATSFPPIPATTATVEIVIPVYNEERGLEASVTKLNSYLKNSFPYAYRITIANNGSSDNTWAVATKLQETFSAVKAFNLDQKGRGRALKAAWQASTADVVSYMDVDLSTSLDGFLPMVQPLIEGRAALATGTRLSRHSNVTRSFKRELISRLYNRMIKLALGTAYSDAQCGFKAIRADAAAILLPEVADNEWFFDTELLTKAERRGWAVFEVPVTWIEDSDSRVRIGKTARDDIKGLARLRKELRKPLVA